MVRAALIGTAFNRQGITILTTLQTVATAVNKVAKIRSIRREVNVPAFVIKNIYPHTGYQL
jgi:hypothetical protein